MRDFHFCFIDCYSEVAQLYLTLGNPVGCSLHMGFPGSSEGKNLPSVQESWVQSLGQQDNLEQGIATHASILYA